MRLFAEVHEVDGGVDAALVTADEGEFLVSDDELIPVAHLTVVKAKLRAFDAAEIGPGELANGPDHEAGRFDALRGLHLETIAHTAQTSDAHPGLHRQLVMHRRGPEIGGV